MNDTRINTDHPQERSGGLAGKWLVVGTLSLFLIVPVLTILVWKLTQTERTTLTLDYADRANWFMQPVKPRPLKYDKFVAGETGKQYKKTDLTLVPEVESVLLRLSRLAQSNDFFTDAGVHDELAMLASNERYGFYPAYLLASWHGVYGDAAQHDRWMQAAYARAGGALAQRLIDADGNPVAGLRLPPVAIGYDRVRDGEIDSTLALVYPAPTSDADGFVYLPTFRSAYRIADPALPPGADPGVYPIKLTLLPQPSNGTEPNWFAVPDGAVGRFDDAVLPPE